MRTFRSTRGRRRAPRRSFVSHTKGKVILAALALAVTPLALYAPWLGFLADAEPVVEFAGRTVAGLLCPALLAGLVGSLIGKRAGHDRRDTVGWVTQAGPLPDEGAAADMQIRVDALQADLDRQGTQLRAAQDALGAEHHEVRADERQRVLIALRAIRRQVTEKHDAAPALRELALRMETVVARLDASWNSGRPVAPLPPRAVAPGLVPSPTSDAPVPADVPVSHDVQAPVGVPAGTDAGRDESSGGSVSGRDEVQSPPVLPVAEPDAVSVRRLLGKFRGRRVAAPRGAAPGLQADSPTSP